MWSNFTLAESDQDPLVIGSISILTGEGASWGTAAKNGVEMAIQKLNEKGGVLGRMLVADHQDDVGDPKKAISAFRYLVQSQGVKFIIGPSWSNTGLPLVDMAKRDKVLMISPSLGVAQFNEGNEFLFNTWPHDYILSAQLADYVYKKGHRRVALVGAQQVWVEEQTKAFKSRFEALGGTIAYLTEPLPGSTDLKADAMRIKAANVDAYVSTTDGIVVGSIVARILKEFHVKLPLYSITVDSSAIEAAQGGFEGLQFLTFLTPTAEFEKEYKARFKIPLEVGADSAYDAVMMLADAIKAAASTDTVKVAAQLAKVKEYSGVSGYLISDGKRGFTKPYIVKKVVNNEAVVE